jgi:hypothetical protein
VEGRTPVDCVDHVTSEMSTFIQTEGGERLLADDDLTNGRLAVHLNKVTIFGVEYDLKMNPDFNAAFLQQHTTEPFAVDTIYEFPSPQGDITWQVRAINDATELVAGKEVRTVTFEVMNSPDRTPEQTQKKVYIVTDPADYMPVYSAVIATGARVNNFALTARNKTPSELESVYGRLVVEPGTPAVSLAREISSFDVAMCASGCGTLPYGTTGRSVSVEGIGIIDAPGEGLVGFTITTSFFKP